MLLIKLYPSNKSTEKDKGIDYKSLFITKNMVRRRYLIAMHHT